MITQIRLLFQRPRDWLSGNPQHSLQLVIVSLVILASAYLSQVLVKINSLNQLLTNPVLLLIAAVAVSITILTRPKLGLLIQVPSLIVISRSVGTGSETRISLSVLLLALLIGLWLFDMVARQRTINVYRSSTLAALLAFLLAGWLSLGVAQLPWFDFALHAPLRAQIGELGIYLLSFGAFLLVGNQLQDVETLEKITKLFFIFVIIVLLGDVIPPLSRFTGYFVNSGVKGSLLWTWLVGLAFGQLVLNHNLSRRWQITLIGILIAVFYVGFIKYRAWSSGWFPPAVAVAVIVWFAFPRFRALLVIFSVLAAVFFSNSFYQIVMTGDNQYSMVTRLSAWQIILKLVQTDPIFGLGLANYYWFTPLIPIMGYSVVFNSHNNYVDLIAQTGILGTLCFIWFSWMVTRLGLRLRSRTKNDFSQAFVYGALGAWIGTLVAGMLGDWILPFVYNIGFTGLPASLIGWFFLGGLLFFERLDATKKGETSSVSV